MWQKHLHLCWQSCARELSGLLRMHWSAEALRELAGDLHPARSNPDRERAAAMLSSLTIFLEHHPALLDAGVFPALMATVMDEQAVPQARGPSAVDMPCAAPDWERMTLAGVARYSMRLLFPPLPARWHAWARGVPGCGILVCRALFPHSLSVCCGGL